MVCVGGKELVRFTFIVTTIVDFFVFMAELLITWLYLLRSGAVDGIRIS
jgi:hypothetical protein